MPAQFVTTDLLYTYTEPSIIIDGVQYIWNGTMYEPSTQIDVDTQDQIGIRKKVVLKFSPYIQPNTVLAGDEIEVFVDGVVITDASTISKTSTSVSITFNEVYLLTQRTISFKCNRAVPLLKYVVKSRVTAGNDVVIEEFGIDDVIPELGTTQPISISTVQPSTLDERSSNAVTTEPDLISRGIYK